MGAPTVHDGARQTAVFHAHDPGARAEIAMCEYSLVYPMLAMVLLTFAVAVVLFRARLRAVREGQTPVSYFRLLQGSPEPEFLAKPTRHLTNLFETPVPSRW